MDNEHECECSGEPNTRVADAVDDCERSLVEADVLREGPGFRVFEILPPTAFSWGNLAGKRLDWIVGAAVPVSEMPEGLLIVRVHENAIAARASAKIVAELITLSADDPETTFVWALSLAEIVVDATSGSFRSFMERLRCDMGTHVRIHMQLSQTDPPTANAATFSIEMITREGTGSYAERGCSCAHEY